MQTAHFKIKFGNIATKLLIVLVVIVFVCFCTTPLAWMISTSLKKPSDILGSPKWITSDMSLDNYLKALTDEYFLSSLFNSIMYSSITTLITVLFATFAGYCLARFTFRGNKTTMFLIILSQMIPTAVMLVPFYFLLNSLGMIDTQYGLLIPYLGIAMPLSVWMTRGYFLSVPRELEEAAMTDGCSRVGALFRIVFPLVAPGIVATAVYAFSAVWGDLMYALIFIHTATKQTLAVHIVRTISFSWIDYGTLMAGSILASIPPILFFIFLQRYFVKGLIKGAVKG